MKTLKKIYCLYKSKDPYSITLLNSLLPKNVTLAGLSSIDKIPLNSNGKVDHERLKELLNLDNSKSISEKEDARLNEMIGLWQSVFGLDAPITETTAFFDLGGDSLAALKLVAQINNKYSAELRLIDVIENDTPEMLIKLLR